MGIKGLYQFIRKKYPGVCRTVHLSEYAYKRVAIDISMYVYKYKAVNPKIWLNMFINLIACLRRNNVHCVFIYDTRNLEDKKDELAKRKVQRDKKEQEAFDLEEGLEIYHTTGEITSAIQEFAKKKGSAARNLLTEDINMQYLEREIERTTNQAVSVTEEDFLKTKELFRILDVPFCQAVTEGEATCAKLCRLKKVFAALSEDSDLLAYGTPIVLSKINVGDGTCVEVNFRELLNKTGWSRDQFLDFCIMLGCDFNKNIKGVGPAGAYRLIDQYGSIEGVAENTDYDISILKHERVREIFKNPRARKISVPFCGNPDFERLSVWLQGNNSNLTFAKLKQDFGAPQLTILEE